MMQKYNYLREHSELDMLRFKKTVILVYILLFVSFLFVLSLRDERNINIVTDLPLEPLHNLLKCLEISVYNGNISSFS